MAKDDEVAPLMQTLNEVETLMGWSRQLDQVANTVIEARFFAPASLHHQRLAFQSEQRHGGRNASRREEPVRGLGLEQPARRHL
jgi:hypothetical protein